MLSKSVVLAAIAVAPLQAAPRQPLKNHVPQAVLNSRKIGPVAPATRMQLAIGLPVRNPEELASFVEQVADPQSPIYRHYLSADEFAARFGPTQEDYDKLAAFLEASGLEVSGRHPNRMILDISGSVSAIDRTLHVNMTVWDHPQRGRFFAPDRDPWLDVDVPVLDVSGLDNFVLPRPMSVKAAPMASATPFVSGSGPSGLFIGRDFRAAYAPGVTLTGSGQSIGLFELDGFYSSDVAANFARAGLPPSPVQTVLLDGYSGAAGSSNIEVILDIMMAAYMAPGANVIVYEGTNWNDILNRMATDNAAKQLSCSWVFSPINATTEQIFKQMIAQGQSFLQASGDSGKYTGSIWPPADNPNVTVVGGTSLSTTGPGGSWLSESAWGGSGGGVSTTYPIPSYQQSVNMASLGGSATMRNIPDVALTADIQMYVIYNNGTATAVGGTSAAAPLWAGFVALANQQAASQGKPTAGFLNPTIYSLGKSSGYSSGLHDIVSGSNGFAAASGFDLATGWGTPNGQVLIHDLVGTAAAPSFGLSSSVTSLFLQAGASATAAIQIIKQSGFTGAVTLGVSGLPSGVTGTFGPINSSGASILTLTAASGAVTSTSSITITGTSGGLTSSMLLTLQVAGSANFSLKSSAGAVTVAQGGTAQSAITVVPVGGFAGNVSLSVSGLPAGVTAAFTPPSTTLSSTLTFTASASAAAASANVTVTGTSGNLTTKTTIALTVATSGFAISSSVANVRVAAGSTASATVSIAKQGAFSGTVALTVSGLPPGVTAAFNPASTATTSNLTFTASSAAAATSSQVTVKGVSGSLSATVTIVLTVVPPPDFAISISPGSLTVLQGSKGAVSISATALNGFSGAITLSTSSLPSGVTGAFSSPGGGIAIETFAVAASASAGSVNVTVIATSGSLVHTALVNLTVAAHPSGSATVDLSSAYNVAASAIDSVPFTNGGLDGLGRSYSGALLGSSLNSGGGVFTFGPMGAPSAVSGKTVPLPAAKYAALKLLATGVNGNQPAQTFTITYSDGTRTAFTQSLSDWYTPQNYPGESSALRMNYRDNSDGTRDGRTFYLYGYNLALNNTKTLSSITLPGNRNVVVLAITLTGSAPSLVPASVDLSKAFNGTGIYADGKTISGGLDGVGNAYSASLLGVSQVVNNVPFQLGAANASDVVSRPSAAIPLPSGKYSSLLILGAAVNGAQTSQSFKLTYGDGTSATFTQNVSDWMKPGGYSAEATVLTMPYRNTASGGRDSHTTYLYQYSFNLDETKTVSSVTLPANANVKILAMTLKQ